MSATEDATRNPRASRAPLILATLVGVAAGLAVALVLAPESLALFHARVPWTGDAPAATGWPGTPRPGERVVIVAVPGGHELEVRAARAPRARRIAEALASRRAAGVDALAQALDGVRAAWRARIEPAPLPPLAPAADGASWLLADAARRRDLARALPMPYAAGLSAAPAGPDEAVAGAESALESALATAVPARVRDALVALAAAEDAHFARGVPGAGAPAADRGAAWRHAQLERAEMLESLAALALDDQTPFQGQLALAAALPRVVELSDVTGDPYAPLVASAAAPPISVEPLAVPWAALLGTGGLLGGLVALLAAALARRGRRTGPAAHAPALVPARDPSPMMPWLHVVAGPSPAAALRGAFELAAHALARRERVLVVDAGGAKLHERLQRDSRWGLAECLGADMPVLGMVQYAGRPGLYLLARGNSGRACSWAGLGRCLDDARLHFGRVVFVVDRTTPREFGEALAGRPLEGWWAAAIDRLPETAVSLTTRLGIAFSGMNLNGLPDASLEVLGARTAALAAALPPRIETVEAPPVEAEPLPLPAAPPEPVVLDCDLQVQQRLRFLAWMRRVQSESRQGAARAASR